jgi:hypothetical protein
MTSRFERCGRRQTKLGWRECDGNNGGVRELRERQGDGGAGWTITRREMLFPVATDGHKLLVSLGSK